MLDTPEENTPKETGLDHVDLTATIVSAYVTNNSVRPADLNELIASVHQTLKGLSGPATPAADQIKKPTPAEVKKSITPEALISFEDGKPYKTLRRHLTMRGLSPEAYRAKYGLPADYPMTAASYSEHRAELARAAGLGSYRKAASKAAEPDETASDAPKRRGRSAKAS
ncbi:MucR family transcriptional regulator [Methylobacterium flocculans]|uniref:MucR family transcriptional regulator n=1 Tax=Methylobacterium flocculans TaxID=2984843 RepID=UPI0021F322B9|nr:MucR family transcriptional regulator [Methylobacterium sp. FF17]